MKTLVKFCFVVAAVVCAQFVVEGVQAQSTCPWTVSAPEGLQICPGEEITVEVSVEAGGPEGAVEEAFGTGQTAAAPRFLRLADGSYYVAGVYVSPYSVGGVGLPGYGSSDVYVAKFTAADVLEWVATGGSNRAETLTGLAAHPDGGVAVTVNHLNPVVWSGTGGTSASLSFSASSNSNHNDGHVIRMGSNGNILWGASLNGGSNEGMNNVVCSPQGKVLVAAGFNGCCPSYFSAQVNGPLNSVSVGSFGSNYGSGALISFASNGQIEWTNTQHARDTGLAPLDVDDAGNIYVAGGFRTWGPGTPFIYIDVTGVQRTLPNPGIGRAFIVKLNAAGFWQWGYSFGNNGYGASGAIGVRGLEIGPDGNVYVVGSYFADPVSFNSNGGASVVLPSRSTDGGFGAVYSPSGGLVSAGLIQPSTEVTSWANDVTWTDGAAWVCGGFAGAGGGVVSLGLSDGFAGQIDWSTYTLTDLEFVGGPDSDDLVYADPWTGGAAFGGSALAALASPAVAAGISGGFVYVPGVDGLPTPAVVWSDGFEGAVRTFSPSSSETWSFIVSNGTGASCSGSISIEVLPLACGDPSAANYDPTAACPVTSPAACAYCGCTDPASCDYDPAAVCDDGSCTPASGITGCSDPSACNFDPAVTCPAELLCIYPPAGAPDCAFGAAFCGGGTLWDAFSQTCLPDPDVCALLEDTCPSDVNGDGVVSMVDLLELLSNYATHCPD